MGIIYLILSKCVYLESISNGNMQSSGLSQASTDHQSNGIACVRIYTPVSQRRHKTTTKADETKNANNVDVKR